MSEKYFKGYWMITNRCNLKCSYCVLENAPSQLRAELSLDEKKELLSHLYHNLNFRRLTLSGGEILIMGKKPPSDFIELLRHIKQFRTNDPKTNLQIELYTNGTYLTEEVADEMKNIVDMVAITIDGTSNSFLTQLGRNNQKFPRYYDNLLTICRLMSERGIIVKLHSVISQKNYSFLASEVRSIVSAIEQNGGKISCWKFYQYMSYDDPRRDQAHAISPETYQLFTVQVKEELCNKNLPLHFKDNKEMNDSLFNILSYGNAQYMLDNDTWTTSRRTEKLISYHSIDELFEKNDLNEAKFRQFHELTI